MWEFSVPTIIAGLEEVARTIGRVMAEELKRKPIEKDLERLYNNIKFYYQKTRQLLREKDNAEELAKTIEEDDLFFMYVTNEKAEKIVEALKAVAILSDKNIVHIERRKGVKYTLKQARYDKRKVVFWILKCLEAAKNISIK